MARSAAKRAATAARNAQQTCQQCGGTFSSQNQRMYCSKSCGAKAYRYRADERGGCSRLDCDKGVRAKGLCVGHYNSTYLPGSQKRSPGNPERRRSALRIKTQKRRAAMRGVDVEAVDRDVVGDRDGWHCGICRRKVNRRLAWPHPRSASLDHIVPISQHGPHTYANTRISHLGCNMARSNRGGNEQLALIG